MKSDECTGYHSEGRFFQCSDAVVDLEGVVAALTVVVVFAAAVVVVVVVGSLAPVLPVFANDIFMLCWLLCVLKLSSVPTSMAAEICCVSVLSPPSARYPSCPFLRITCLCNASPNWACESATAFLSFDDWGGFPVRAAKSIRDTRS